MSVLPIYSSLDRAVGRAGERLEGLVSRPAIAVALIVVVWACAVFPHISVRSFIWEEGTNAEIGRDVLFNGHFIHPVIYGVRWSEKPSLLGWLIAGVAAITGEVNEFSSRLPAMASAVVTALLVWSLARRYASATAALFAALTFLFCPMLLQKLAIAEPDTVITLLSFAAFVLWWNGAEAGPVSIVRWIGCGVLLAVLAMAKGPQPAGFFALGVFAYIVVERRFRDLPGLILCMLFPVAAVVAWGAAVYRPGDGATWVGYARLNQRPSLAEYAARNGRSLAQLLLELAPAILMLPLVPWPWRRQGAASSAPAVVAPLILYSGACTAILVFWPGFASRYAMPIAPALAVLAAIAWDAAAKSGYLALRRAAATMLGTLIAFQLALVTIVMPLFADRFGGSRLAGEALDSAMRAAPAPFFCYNIDTNQLFYLRQPPWCLDVRDMAALSPPAWLLVTRETAEEVARLRPDLNVRIVVGTESGPQLTATRLEAK